MKQKYSVLRPLLIGAFLLALASGFMIQQEKKKKMNTNEPANKNPLICDPKIGACEVPGASAVAEKQVTNTQKAVRVIYFTDPICSSCWGIEPQLRRMKLEYPEDVEVEYHMGGLLPSWEVYNSGGISKPSDVSHHWDEVSAYYDMPIDGDVWLEDPLSSSYPPSIAFKAAQLQSPKKAIVYLRRIREMVFLEKKNITKWEHLHQAALDCGLDAKRLKEDFDGPAQQLFRDDLQLAAKMGVRGFPTLFFTNAAGTAGVVYGFRPYAQFEEAILKSYPPAKKSDIPSTTEKLFSYYPTLTVKEVSVISGVSREVALSELNRLAAAQRIEEKRYKSGSIWIVSGPVKR